jgi:DNA-binding phage protein
MNNYNPEDYYDDELKRVLAEIAAATLPVDKSAAIHYAEIKLKLFMQFDYISRTQHLTQTELAKKVGMSQSNLSRVWSYKSDPKLSTLLKIADALGVELTLSGAPATTRT